MNTDFIMLAAATPERRDGLSSARGSGALFYDLLLIVGLAVALGLLLALVVKLAYRSGGGGEKDKGLFPGSTRRRRRERRPRNPTLAETGGLPPPRTGPPEPPRL